MHLKSVKFLHEKFPTQERYPYNIDIVRETEKITFNKPVTFFLGENGSGKSTVLKALARKCQIYIWEGDTRTRYDFNPYEKSLHKYFDIEWANGPVKGSFFASEIFKNFARIIDQWAVSDPETLKWYGNKSLIAQSHGQSHMSYFTNRFKIKGIYFIDEPENALSPKKQIEMLNLINNMSEQGHAQFIIATHSPIILACKNADIYSFDNGSPELTTYQETDHFNVYYDFLNHRRNGHG